MSFSGYENDQQERFVLGFVFALVALVVLVVTGSTLVKRAPAVKAQTAPAALVMQAAPIEELASVRVENGMVLFFFATAKAELATGASEALSDIVKGVEEGKKAVISGFHDATGDAAANAELAKQRAMAVRDALLALGVAEDKIELKTPAQTQGTGHAAQARRVEVALSAL
ncbi:MAG: OmpA family protein [Burkholderiaceae bacterium]